MHIRFASPRAMLAAAALLAALSNAALAEGISPTPVPPGTPPGSGTPIAGVNKTPTHLCQPGSSKFITATRPLSLPSQRYCTDTDWNVRDVRVEGASLLWRVPFTNGHVDCSCTYAAGTTAPPPGPASGDSPTPPPATGASDRITPGVVMRELRALGFQPELKAGSRGLPGVNVTIDGYRWAILFYACDAGASLEQRHCGNIQFFSGYTMSTPISSVTMNKWNTEKRFARGYTFIANDGKYGARVEMDVLFANTGSDPARTFRAYYGLMKIQAADFRKLINFN